MDNDGNKVVWTVVIISAIAIIGLMFINFMPSQTSNIKTAIGNELSSFGNDHKSDNSSSSSNSHTAVGTNLLMNTETATGDMWFTPGNNLSTEKLNGCNVETQTGDWHSARYLFDDLKKRNVINTTDDFVFSAMIRVDPTLKDNPAYINFFSTATDKDSTRIGYIKDYADGHWHQVSVTFKFLTTPTNSYAYSQSLRFELGNSNDAKVYWTQRQLEKGSVATPWCPNPADHIVSD